MKTWRIFGLPIVRIEDSEQRGASPENPNVDITEWAQGLTGGASDSGQIVNRETAMQFSAVYACVRIISETIASLPLAILERSDGYVNYAQHPLSTFIELEPNAVMTRFMFWETMIAHVLLEGNAYAIIERDMDMMPKSFIIVNPNDVEIMYDDRKAKLMYKIDGKIYYNWKILHIAGISFDGVKGLSPISYHRDSIGIGLSEMEFQGKFFKNGAQISGVLENPGKLTDDAYKRIAQSWRNTYEGAQNAGKTAILEGGTAYKTIGIKPIDAQFMEQRRFTIEDIARIYRVPLHLLQDLSRSTNNNIEHQSIDFVQHTIRPHIKRIEAELDRKIFTEKEKKSRKYFTRFNLDALLRGDVRSRGEFYRTLSNIGAINANEVRSMEGMNPYEGGDIYRVPMNTIPADSEQAKTRQENG
jgi:HK97 family phage portal protein